MTRYDLDSLPNYPYDLNACAEFERLLDGRDVGQYLAELWFLILRDNQKDKQYEEAREFAKVTATPLQRCEAFLRVKGKWKK